MSHHSNPRAKQRRKPNAKETVFSKLSGTTCRRGLYYCNYCGKDVSNTPHIRCAQCNDFNLCLECFSVGAELTPHRNTHSYTVVEDLSQPVFHPEWGLDEEVLLLAAVDQYGLGNWTAVAEFVGLSKTAPQCKAHYYGVHVTGDAFPSPTPAPEMAEFEARRAAVAAGAEEPVPSGPTQGAMGGPELSTLSMGRSTLSMGPPPFAGIPSLLRASQQDTACTPVGGAGGVVKAERAVEEAAGAGHKATGGKGGVSPLAVPGASPRAPPGGPQESTRAVHSLYSDPAGGYHIKRKEFDPEYDHDAEILIADMEFAEGDSEEDKMLKLRILDVYNKRLDRRAQRHAFLHQYGLMSMRKVQATERKRTATERETCARLRVFARYNTPQAHDDLVEGLILEQRLRARIQELKEGRRVGARTLEGIDSLTNDQRKARRQAFAIAQLGPGSSPAPGPAVRDDGVLRDSGAAACATAAPAGGNKGANASLAAWRTYRGVGLDITCLPGTELLSAKERELCASDRLLPVHYLALKDIMLRECERNGHITRQEARTFFRLDPIRCLRLYDLWNGMGWIGVADGAAS